MCARVHVELKQPGLPEAGIVPGERQTLLVLLLRPSFQLHMFVQKACFLNAVKSSLGLWLRLCMEGERWDPGTIEVFRERGCGRRTEKRSKAKVEAVFSVGGGRWRAWPPAGWIAPDAPWWLPRALFAGIV